MEEFCRGTERRFSRPMSLMMCKKCFSAFERYRTLANQIINKMKKVLGVLKQDVEFPAIKKPRLGFGAGHESFPSSSPSLSPGVAVCFFLLYVMQQLDIDMHVILQVHVGYKNTKTYILTHQCKKLGSGKENP